MTAKRGLVLAGGAARGAYEAGILRFIYGELSERLGHHPWPDLVSGTSVGTLNGTFVVGREPAGVRWLSELWRNMSVNDVFDVSWTRLARAACDSFREVPFAIASATPLQRLIVRRFPRRAIRRAVEQHGVTWLVGVTDLGNGQQVLFVDSKSAPTWSPRPHTRLVHTPIRAHHALASAALPVLFPPVVVDGRMMVDGGIRMNTPLAPVLRAGADNVLVVSLKRVASDLKRAQAAPNLPYLVGKTLNALLLDTVELEVHEARRVNSMIAWGTERFGEAFATGVERDLGWKTIDLCFMTPSEDLGKMAAATYAERPPALRGALRKVLEGAASNTGPDADLLSYVYFDRAFTAEVERIGFEDARRREEELAKWAGEPGA